MSDYLPQRSGGSAIGPRDRWSMRALERVQRATSLETSRVRSIEDVEIAKVEAISAITTAALIETASISAAEAATYQRAPHAAARLRLIADSGAGAMAEVIMHVNRTLR